MVSGWRGVEIEHSRRGKFESSAILNSLDSRDRVVDRMIRFE